MTQLKAALSNIAVMRLQMEVMRFNKQQYNGHAHESMKVGVMAPHMMVGVCLISLLAET